jgi:bacterial surface protein 26-residue repeat
MQLFLIININTKEVTKSDGSTYTAWDTSKVTNMFQMFNVASAFDKNIENWNTSNVTNMSFMFNGAEKLIKIK